MTHYVIEGVNVNIPIVQNTQTAAPQLRDLGMAS